MGVRLRVMDSHRSAAIRDEHDDDDVFVKPSQDGFMGFVRSDLELRPSHRRRHERAETPNGFGKNCSEHYSDSDEKNHRRFVWLVRCHCKQFGHRYARIWAPHRARAFARNSAPIAVQKIFLRKHIFSLFGITIPYHDNRAVDKRL